MITHGSKIGIGAIYPQQVIPLVRAARERGLVWPVVKATDNAGICLDVKRIEARTLTIYRRVAIDTDAIDYAPFWKSDGTLGRFEKPLRLWTATEMRWHAQIVLDRVLGHLNAEERAAIDFVEPVNEANPAGYDGYAAYGRYCLSTVDEANKRGMKLALPAFNAGGPQWDECQAFVATGVFGAMRAGGHILTIHEGVFGDSPVDHGLGDLIPGAPSVPPGAGSLCFRYRYLYALIPEADRVPLVISEWYAGGNYHLPVAEQMARFRWYDDGLRRDPYVLAVLPFTVDPDTTWREQNYNYVYPAVLDHLAREKDVPNVTPVPDGGGAARARGLVDELGGLL